MKLPFIKRSTFENYESNANRTITDLINTERELKETLLRVRKKIHKQNCENQQLKGRVAGLKLELSKHKRKRDSKTGRFIKKR